MNSKQTIPSGGIRGLMRDRIIDEVFKKVASYSILVVDEAAETIINSAFRMSDLLQYKITLVESISKKRQPIPQCSVIYLVSATQENMQYILNDWEESNMYQTCAVYFTGACPKSLLSNLKGLYQRHLLTAVVDLMMEFSAVEPLIFDFGTPSNLALQFFNSAGEGVSDQIDIVAMRLSSIFKTMHDFPSVRFYGQSKLCQMLADRVLKELDTEEKGLGKTTGNVLIILDRGIDAIAPCLHELTYQAMLHDIKQENFKNDTVQIGDRRHVIDTADPVWHQLRHLHISDASKHCCKLLNDFQQQNPEMARFGRKDANANTNLSLKDMGKIIKTLPAFTTEKAQLGLHIKLCEELNEQYIRLGIERIVTAEQALATGEDNDGRKLSLETQIAELKKALGGQMGLRGWEKKRLAAIGVAVNGPNFIKELESITPLDPAERNMLKSLDALKPRRVEHRSAEDFEYTTSRFEPAIKKIGRDLLSGCLAEAEFPWARQPFPQALKQQNFGVSETSLKPGRDSDGRFGNIKKSSQQKQDVETKTPYKLDLGHGDVVSLRGPEKYIFFILGGITWSECRAIYELVKEKKAECILGGTSIHTPDDFVKRLTSLS